jgi:hypothetical protein
MMTEITETIIDAAVATEMGATGTAVTGTGAIETAVTEITITTEETPEVITKVETATKGIIEESKALTKNTLEI